MYKKPLIHCYIFLYIITDVIQSYNFLHYRLRQPTVETETQAQREESRALAVRSPTAELERALRDQLHYSHALDEDIMEQVTSSNVFA